MMTAPPMVGVPRFVVGRRAVVADELPVAAAHEEELDEHGRAKERDDQEHTAAIRTAFTSRSMLSGTRAGQSVSEPL